MRVLLQETKQVPCFLSPDSIVIDSQKVTVRILLWIKAKEKFAEFYSRPVATFTTQDVDIFLKALGEYAIKWLLILRVEVKSGVRCELLSDCLSVAC